MDCPRRERAGRALKAILRKRWLLTTEISRTARAEARCIEADHVEGARLLRGMMGRRARRSRELRGQCARRKIKEFGYILRRASRSFGWPHGARQARLIVIRPGRRLRQILREKSEPARASDRRQLDYPDENRELKKSREGRDATPGFFSAKSLIENCTRKRERKARGARAAERARTPGCRRSCSSWLRRLWSPAVSLQVDDDHGLELSVGPSSLRPCVPS